MNEPEEPVCGVADQVSALGFFDTIKDLIGGWFGGGSGKPATYTYLSPPFTGYAVPRGFNRPGNLTQDEIDADMALMFRMYESVCGVKFVPVTSGRVDVKFVCKPLNSAGHYSNGVIEINSNPQGDFRGNDDGALGRVSGHEMGHHFGWGHSNDPKCVMHSNATSGVLCKGEVDRLVRKFGPPK